MPPIAPDCTDYLFIALALDDRPASLWLVPQLNVPIWTAVSMPWSPSSHQARRRAAEARPAARQTRRRSAG